MHGKPVLVVGAGPVALRKARGLLKAGALVRVVAPEVRREFAKLPVRLARRRFRARDLGGMAMVFAATNDRRVNHRVATGAKRLGIPVNVADSLPECDFILPAHVVSGAVQVALSTGGRDPRLAVAWKRRIAALLAGSGR